jgi:hypothetical protein
MAPSRVRIPPSPLAAVAATLILAAGAACGSDDEEAAATAGTTSPTISTEEFGTCLVTEEPWHLDPSQRVGFCVARYEESYVSCVTFTDDPNVPPDDVEFHGNDGRLEETNIDVWETEGCGLALPAARDWLADEIAKP